MITTTKKTVMFAALIAVSIMSLSVMTLSDVSAKQEATHTVSTDSEKQQRFDELSAQLEAKQIESRELSIDNSADIDSIKAELEELFPTTPTKYIEPELKSRMLDAQMKLMESEFPLYAIGITSETGKLNVKVYSDKATNIDDQIQEFVGKDIPLEIEYGQNNFKFQASNCTSSSGPCNPIIGGSFGEDKTNGKDCTVSIAVVRDNWPFADEDGVIIPDHCNPNTSDFYQADKDVAAEKVGAQTKDGGWYCDCDFVKSNSRSIDTDKVYQGTSTDYSLSGNADAADETYVWLFGATSGKDYGRVKEVNQSWQDPNTNNWFTDLYKVENISFTDGDSGAPMIDYGNTKYSGMNIGTDGTYNLVHDWTFLKSKLGLN